MATMTKLLTKTTPQSERVAEPVSAREPKIALKRIVVVADPEHDLAWLGRLGAAQFDPILLTSNFDAVQMLTENLDLRMVLFSQRSSMMDGIAACQLLRQSRSEDDAAVVLMLNENLDHAVIEAFAAGVSDVVCHPFHTGELIARLDAMRQRLLLWGDAEINAPGFQAQPSNSQPDSECSPMRPHFGGPRRDVKPQTSPDDETSTDEPSMAVFGASQPLAAEAAPAAVAVPDEAPPALEPQTRVATQLAGDWLLTHDLPHGIAAPALDLSQLKFVSSLPVHRIESARQRGELSEVLLDRVWVCPQCSALPSFRPACPCCGSAGVERDQMMHHFACAFVGPTSEFQWNDDGLSCPKCCAQRLMVGTDCEFLDGPWRCSDCDWSPAELEIVGHCLKCGFRFPAQQAILQDLVGHHVDRLAALADVAHPH